MHDTLKAFDTALAAALARLGLPIDDDRLGRLRAHFQAVIDTNRTMNLTRITNPVEAAVKHYADSLAVLAWVEKRKIAVRTVLDVGTGAGFPALPLAVMRSDWLVTAIDATGKKVDFLRQSAAAIGLKNLRCVHAHSEHWKPSTTPKPPLKKWGKKGRGSHGFQLVVFRALTALPKSLEQTAGQVAPDGWLVAYKTASVPQGEQEAADALATKLQLRLRARYAYDLQLDGDKLDRVLYVYQKSAVGGQHSVVSGKR